MLEIIKNHPRLLLAEWQKLKRTPALYLLFIGALFTATIVFVGHSLDVHHMVKLNMNPWERYFDASISIFALFLIVPFLVLFVSATTYIEQQANGWKFIYNLTYHRGQLIIAKLFAIIILLLISIALM
ncbi:MAG: ABC transporter permease, partial [Bacteroidota bacterium]